MLAYKGSKYQLLIKKELFICLSVQIKDLLFPQLPKQEIGEHMTHMQKNQGLTDFCLDHANFHATF